jgi:hypothetical protein
MIKTAYAIVIALIVGAASFYGGMAYANSKNPSRTAQNFQRNGAGFPGGARQGAGRGANGGFVNGQVIKMDSNSITLQLNNNGGSKIVFFSDKTNVSKFAEGTKSDIAVGKNVMVTGTTNSDGSILAQTLQIRPEMPADLSGQNGQGGQNNPNGQGTQTPQANPSTNR